MRKRVTRYFAAIALVIGAVFGLSVANAFAVPTTSWVDDSLQANSPFSHNSIGFGTPTITYSVSGATITVPLTGNTSNAAVSSTSGSLGGGTYTASVTSSVLTVNLSGAGSGTLQLIVSDDIGLHNVVVKGAVTITGTSSGGGSVTVSTDSDQLTVPPNTVYPNVKFAGTEACWSATSVSGGPFGTPTTTCAGAGVNSWSNTDLPGGLSIESATGLLTPGSAIPGTYSWATISGATAQGASASETFNLTVIGHKLPNTVAYQGTIRLDKLGMCLDDRFDSATPGAVVQVWRCNDRSNQQWTVMKDGTIQHNSLCLNAAGTVRGDKVSLETCNGDGLQRWNTQHYRITNNASGLVLDDTAFGGSGTQQEVWTNNGGANQIWSTF